MDLYTPPPGPVSLTLCPTDPHLTPIPHQDGHFPFNK